MLYSPQRREASIRILQPAGFGGPGRAGGAKIADGSGTNHQLKICPLLSYFYPDGHASGLSFLLRWYSHKSPGWQSRASQSLSITSTGMWRAAPVQRADIVGGRIPVTSASCFCVISRRASITLILDLIKCPTSLPLLYPVLVILQYVFRKNFLRKLRKQY